MLVGTGVTFDTGGLQRTPGANMTTMCTDMAAGAAVLGAARRPRDVVRHNGGRTSEIDNTDARGAKDDGMISRGATGFGARLPQRWIESLG